MYFLGLLLCFKRFFQSWAFDLTPANKQISSSMSAFLFQCTKQTNHASKGNARLNPIRCLSTKPKNEQKRQITLPLILKTIPA